MKCLSESDLKEWMRRRLSLETEITSHTILRDLEAVGFNRLTYRLPWDSSRKVFLAQLVRNLILNGGALLVYLPDWEYSESFSGGYPQLLVRLRQALGENRSVKEMPGHLFLLSEVKDAQAIIILALEFLWDCLVLDEIGKSAIFISHDEFLVLMSREQSLLAKFKDAVVADTALLSQTFSGAPDQEQRWLIREMQVGL